MKVTCDEESYNEKISNPGMEIEREMQLTKGIFGAGNHTNSLVM